ncbi:MAG: winged helix-turn-helix transcriptional regulator [Candidatus Sumerlaeia bacterium]|nr:winged helix-turn-helix transcriptional regulator [Candidatus Sumerlaeia bacterium]
MSHFTDEAFQLIAAHLKALADPLRLRILDQIRDEPKYVKDIVRAVAATQPTVSKHLGILRRAGIVETERNGTLVQYRIRDPRVCELCDLLMETVVRRLERDSSAFAGAVHD